MLNHPQNIEVVAPTTKAIVVKYDYPRSTKKKIMAAINMIKRPQILYSSLMKAEAPIAIMAPISGTVGEL